MKRITTILAIIYFFYSQTTCYSQDSYSFENNEYYFRAYSNDLRTGPVKFTFINKQFYIEIPELDWDKKEMGENIKEIIQGQYSIENKDGYVYVLCKNNKYLVLYYETTICILVDCANNDTFFGLNKNSKNVYSYGDSHMAPTPYIGIEDGWPWEVSSYLTETLRGNEVKYNGVGRYFLQFTTPWVEGKDDYGIGEWMEKIQYRLTDEIIFINGYIDPNRPDLYSANSRVKEIMISVDNENWTYAVMDTAHPQILKLPKLVSGNIRFTIKDVYPGTKYTDTCIAGIYFLRIRGQ
jgi:hypothetical protein